MGRKKLDEKDYAKQRTIRLTDKEWEIFKQLNFLGSIRETIAKIIASS